MLTQSQQKALEATRHVSVTANAGSGKTLVLVERYVSLILSGKARVSEVVAITFTEKAASELKRKIATKVAERIAAAPDHRTRLKLEELREELSGAVIDTIHSFCSRILREFPVEADVDAAFTVIEEIDRNVLRERAVRQTFEMVLGNKHPHPGREEVFELLRSLGKRKVLDIVHALVRKRELVDRWLRSEGLFSRSDDEILQLWSTTLTDSIHRAMDDPLVTQDLTLLVHAIKEKERKSAREAFETFEGSRSVSERVSAFVQLAGMVLTKNGKLREIFPDPDDMLQEAARRLRRTRDLVQLHGPGDEEQHRSLLKQIRLLLAIYQEVIQRYDAAKAEGAYLDFDDLQLRTRKLLENEKICQKLSQRFKYIMVDEYQDTNLLQYEVLLPLLSNLQKGNLCIVGDPKQSIYRFRDADVSVFNRTKRDILRVAGPESAVTLGESFRLLRDVAAFINLVFSSVMKGEDDEFEMPYEPLLCGRQNEAPGRVELLLPADDAQPDALSEEEMIARRILQLRHQRYQIFGKDEVPHPLRFRDVAILLRSRTKLGRLEQALNRYHVPYLVTGGVGYFQTQPVYDFYHYFRFLLNTEDDVALVGILRSPFFNVSDAELLEFRLKNPHGVLWDGMKKGNAALERFPAIARAATILRDDLEVASRLTTPELIDRIIEQTAYMGFAAGVSRAEQLLANLEKLKRVARQYTDRGFTTLYDFTARLQRLIDEQEEEGQATVDVDADAVRIITIHSAKGLEFPVVFLPSLDRDFRFDKEPYLDEQLGFAFQPSEKDEQAVPIVKFIKERTRAKTIAEERRVFYVGCTRARDLLVLSASEWKATSSSNCLSWLMNVLDIDPHDDAPQKIFDVSTQCLRLTNGGYVSNTVHHQLPVYVVRPKDLSWDEAIEAHEAVKPEPPTRVHIEPILAGDGNEVFSASKIRTYLECPSKYYLRYVVGLPSSTVRLFNDAVDDEEDTEIPRDLRGRAFHYVMQHIATIGDDRGKIQQELKNFIARDSYSILSEPSVELEALTDSVLAVVGSSFWKEVQRSSESRTEFTIAARLEPDIILGTLDRVYRDSDGVWTVLDFKTDAVTEETLREKILRYEPQVKFYALLVRKFFGCSRVRACLLFSALVDSPARFEFSSDELDEYERHIRLIIGRIRAGEFTRPEKPCAECPFLPDGCSF